MQGMVEDAAEFFAAFEHGVDELDVALDLALGAGLVSALRGVELSIGG